MKQEAHYPPNKNIPEKDNREKREGRNSYE